MKTRCKPGDRAKVIISQVCPENIGLIVVVVRPYQPKEIIDGATWVDNCPSWVVVSLGRPIFSIREGDNLRIEHQCVAVIPDYALVPLDDDDAGIEAKATKRKPRVKRVAVNHG